MVKPKKKVVKPTNDVNHSDQNQPEEEEEMNDKLDAITKQLSGLAPAELTKVLAEVGRKDTLPPEECRDAIKDLYNYGTLDCIIQLAEAIYEDMRGNPEQYRRVPQTVLQDITKFEKVGKDESWPDRERRAQIYSAELGLYEVDLRQPANQPGARDSSSEFRDHANALRDAAKEFFRDPQVVAGERNVSPIRSAVNAFRPFLLRRCGFGLAVNVSNIKTIFDASKKILKDPSIATVFNANPISQADFKNWPTGGPSDTDITQFISEELRDHLSGETVSMLQERFTNLQQVVEFGSRTIGRVLSEKWDDWKEAGDKTKSNLYSLIDDANEWGNALERFHFGKSA